MTDSERVHPYIPNSNPDIKAAMLAEIGLTDIDQLYDDIPEHLRSSYDGSKPRGYYDREKYKRTAKADRRTSQPEDQDPPQC